ncbi:recombinase family protein [Oenococcus kitaharae]|uniref:recombinase family protein n=1 Tax=Oenococcus kitaharae TaxID=336988 RepID=UPI0004800F15|nr:recombinase family protein [Oenococcus kitaharae]OEY85759.1 Sin recombinase [Oenococcus kitaharae]
MSLVFYARVSSTDQNLARQLARAKKVQADKIFADKLSGKDIQRPEFIKCLAYLREGDTLEVLSLDRLSRNYQDIKNIVSELRHKHVAFIADDLPNLATGNPLIDQFMLDMIIGLMSFVAQNEREKIKERQRQGIIEAKKRGAYIGKQLEYAPNSVNPGKRAIYFGLQAAYQSQTYSITQLAQQYGIARSTVYRVMKRIKEEE